MKKLVIAAAVLALSTGVNAQQAEGSASGIGGLTTATLTAMGVSAAVAAAIISNNRGSNIEIDPEKPIVLVCNDGDGSPVAGVCTNTTSTVTVTGTGTNTSTTTVPVVTTYPAIVQQ